MTQPPIRSNPSPLLVLAPFLERFVQGRRVAVLGDARSGLAEELLARGARVAHAHDPASEPAARRGGGPGAGPAGEGGFDVAVVADPAAASPEALLARARQLVAAAGLVVVVTPNRGADDRAFGYYDLYDALSLHFAHVKMVGQVAFGGYALVDFGLEGEPDVAVDTSLAEAQGREAQFYIGIGSGRPLELEGYSIVELPGGAPRAEAPAPAVDAAALERVGALEKALERERASLAEALLGLQTERASSEALREAHRALEGRSAALVDVHRQLEGRAQALAEAYQALEARAEGLAEARRQLEARLHEEARRAEAEGRRAEVEARRAEAEARRAEGLAQGVAELRAALQALELERAESTARAAQLARELHELRQRAEPMARQLAEMHELRARVEAAARQAVESQELRQRLEAAARQAADVHELRQRAEAAARQAAEVPELRQRAEAAARQLAELQAQATRARQALAAAEEQRQRAAQREQALARTIAELEARPRGVDPAEHQALREQAAALREHAAALRAQIAALEGEVRARDEAHEVEVSEVEATLRERARELVLLRREVDRRGAIVRELLDEREAARQAIGAGPEGEAAARARLEEVAAELGHRQAELDAARARVRELSAALERATAAAQAAASAAAAAPPAGRGAPAPAEAGVASLQAELDALRRALLQERQERLRLEAERSAAADPSAAVLLEQVAAERGAPG